MYNFLSLICSKEMNILPCIKCDANDTLFAFQSCGLFDI